MLTGNECKQPLYCEIQYTDDGEPRTVDDETAATQGGCTRPREEGAECGAYGVRCADGLYCNATVCAPAAGAGEPCGTCATGLSCIDPDADGAYTCEPPAAVDDTCTSDWQCASSYCAVDLDVPRCRPVSENPALDICHG